MAYLQCESEIIVRWPADAEPCGERAQRCINCGMVICDTCADALPCDDASHGKQHTFAVERAA